MVHGFVSFIMRFRPTAASGVSQITHQPETAGQYKQNFKFRVPGACTYLEEGVTMDLQTKQLRPKTAPDIFIYYCYMMRPIKISILVSAALIHVYINTFRVQMAVLNICMYARMYIKQTTTVFAGGLLKLYNKNDCTKCNG